MKIFNVAVILLILFMANVSAYAQSWALSADLWASPRSAERVSKMPVIRTMVQAWQKQPQQTLDIFYPGGEEGIIWANELKDWLIALGIPGAKIRIHPGNDSEDQLGMSINPL